MYFCLGAGFLLVSLYSNHFNYSFMCGYGVGLGGGRHAANLRDRQTDQDMYENDVGYGGYPTGLM
jgi:hypothetical protein